MKLRHAWFALFGILALECGAAGDYRVVVQEAHRGQYQPMEFGPDGKLAWLVTAANDHVLQVLDPTGPVILRRFFLPDRVESVWIDSKTRMLAVSTRSSIFHGRLTGDDLTEILPGVTGAVRLKEDGKLLAVLGQIPDPKKKEPAHFSFHDSRKLGVYELEEKRWRYIRPTPIVIPILETSAEKVRYKGATALFFDDGALLAGGVGGSVGSMIPITFSVDVHLDLKTGKTRITTGHSSRFGKLIEEKKLDSSDRPPLPDEYKDIDFKRDPKYRPPAALVKAVERLEALPNEVGPEKILKKLGFGEGHIRESTPMPFAVKEDRLELALRRFLRVPGGFGSYSAVLTLSRDGKIEIGPARDTSASPFGAGNRLFFRAEYPEIDLRDLITRKPTVPAKALQAKGSKNLHFLGDATLVSDTGQLALYRTGEEKPIWSRPNTKHRWEEVLVDGAGKTLALVCAGEPILARVLRRADGELIADVPRPEDITHNYVTLALSADGKRLAALHAKEVRIFGTGDGRIVERLNTVGDSHGRDLHSWSGGWLVSGEPDSHFYDAESKKWGSAVPFARVINVQEFETSKGKRLVMQNYNGECCVADPIAGQVLMRWISAEYGQYRAPLWNAVFAAGNALLRPTGWNPMLEVVDLRSFRVVLTIHHVPVEKNIGWIAFTPDGWWDASAGAEQHVAVFDNGSPVTEEIKEKRRNPDAMRKQLRALWR